MKQLRLAGLGWVLLGLWVLSVRAESDQRGVWMWQSGGVYGSIAIINDPLLRTQNVNWMLAKGIDRVYGSYGNFVGGTNETGVIAWNAQLDAAGIESHLLLDGASTILDDPIVPTNSLLSLRNKITGRYVDYNAGRADPAERFDGIHLDIEPQQLSQWDLYPASGDLSLRLENRRQLYLKLLDTFASIRTHLGDQGVPGAPVHADLNDWVDRITPSVRFMWQTATDRDQYFADLAAELDGITLMSYELPTFSQISNRVDWETSSVTGMTVRVALDVDIGASETWPSVGAFWSMADQIETVFGEERGIDIHSYADIRSQYVLAVLDSVSVDVSVSVGVGIGFTTGVAVFVGEKSVDLQSWTSTGVDHLGQGGVKLDFPRVGDRGFFRVAQYGEDAPYTGHLGPFAVHPVASGTNAGVRTVACQVISPLDGEAPEPLPVVIFSADEGQDASVFGTLSAHLASRGFLCVSVGHGAGPETNRLARAWDLELILDQVVAGTLVPGQTAGRVDTNRMVAAGQGLGSTTVLKLCGLQFSPSGQGGVPVRIPDSRIRAGIAISPRLAGTDGLISSSWQTVDRPVLMISGSLDVTAAVAVAADREQAFEALPVGAAYQLWLTGAEHDDFTDTGILLHGDTFLTWYAQSVQAFLDARADNSGAAWLWLRAQTPHRLSGRSHRLDWR